MTTTVFLAVLGAALLHAVWNALVKRAGDKRMTMGAVVLGHVPFAVAVLAVAPAPDPGSAPYVLASVLLHTAYQLFLQRSYRVGDLTQVYPLARGSAPLLVALVSIVVLGERLAPLEVLAVVVIGTGIVSLALVRRADGQRNQHAAVLALITGCFIAAYSLVDGLGARAAGSSLGFYGWVAVGNAAVLGLVLHLRDPGVLGRIRRDGRRPFLIGGGASFAAYAVVVWAFTQAPIALVTALRETSIVFALLIGVFALGERLDLARVVSTMTTLLGAALLRLARS